MAGDPLTSLRGLQEQGLRWARGLPAQVEQKTVWSGVGFRLRGANLVSGLDQVREILTYPPLSRVPGVRPWVKGIANVRGNLLSVLDLNGFLGHGDTFVDDQARVLVVEFGEVFAGLLVDEVLGLRHFFENEDDADIPADLDEGLRRFVEGAYRRDGQSWAVLKLERLVQSAEFLQVA